MPIKSMIIVNMTGFTFKIELNDEAVFTVQFDHKWVYARSVYIPVSKSCTTNSDIFKAIDITNAVYFVLLLLLQIRIHIDDKSRISTTILFFSRLNESMINDWYIYIFSSVFVLIRFIVGAI